MAVGNVRIRPPVQQAHSDVTEAVARAAAAAAAVVQKQQQQQQAAPISSSVEKLKQEISAKERRIKALEAEKEESTKLVASLLDGNSATEKVHKRKLQELEDKLEKKQTDHEFEMDNAIAEHEHEKSTMQSRLNAERARNAHLVNVINRLNDRILGRIQGSDSDFAGMMHSELARYLMSAERDRFYMERDREYEKRRRVALEAEVRSLRKSAS